MRKLLNSVGFKEAGFLKTVSIQSHVPSLVQLSSHFYNFSPDHSYHQLYDFFPLHSSCPLNFVFCFLIFILTLYLLTKNCKSSTCCFCSWASS